MLAFPCQDFSRETEGLDMTDEEFRKRQTDFVEEQEMARQKQTLPAAVDPIEDLQEVSTPSQMQTERDLANQLLGRVQLAQGFAKLLTVSSLMDIKVIKDNKLYKGLSYKAQDGKLLTVSSFEEFCETIGYSRQKIDQDLLNLETFGGEALSSMQQMGLGYRDLRRLRKMPDEDRTLVIEQVTVDMNDKEAVKESILEILETQTRKNDQKLKEVEAEKAAALQAIEIEKAAREKTERKLKQDLADKDALLEVKNQKIEELYSEHNSDMQTPDERVTAAEELLNDYFANLVNGLIVRKSELIGDYAFGGVTGINALFAKTTTACGGEIPEHLKDLIKSQVARVHTELDSALANIGLDDETIEYDEYVPDANDIPLAR